jgi:hypothetical protein
MSEKLKKCFVFTFKYVAIPTAAVWTATMAFLTSVFITKIAIYLMINKQINFDPNVAWHELVVGIILILTSGACYALFKHIKNNDEGQQHHQTVWPLQGAEEEEDGVEEF